MTTSMRDLLGLAPRYWQVRDLVCILFGCSVSIILRKLDGGDKTGQASEPYFRFIGEAYIHGMMDGEAICLSEEEGIQPQTFCPV